MIPVNSVSTEEEISTGAFRRPKSFELDLKIKKTLQLQAHWNCVALKVKIYYWPLFIRQQIM